MDLIVIGASRGLGLCLTRLLLEKGHRVAAGVRAAVPEGLRDLESRWGDRLLVVPADVTNEEQMLAGAERIAGFFGGPADGLCVSAGVLLDNDRVKLLHQCDIAELRRTLDVNVVGPILAAKVFTPRLKPGARAFIVTSEGVGVKSCGTWVPCYGLSKTAATKACGILNASDPGPEFYAVHPGRMNTDMGRTTAQIEPEEAAEGFCRLMSGEIALSPDHWYIDYLGREMEA